ncbi:MAG: protein kinase [Bryobacteraceae bacterium]
MPLAAGEKLSHYEILGPIGAGGMGEVYKARDTRLDRFVAIKVLPEHIASRDDLKARFEREARAVASLNHPHICVLYDIGEERGVQYMALEYLEGETLDARLERGALPLDTALQYAMQIADALDRAHRAGVAHRDIKPGNLMLTRDGVKVLDFGLAKSKAKPGPTEATLVAALTSEGTVLGTPQYMSPELFEGKEADPRADVWAFGAVLFEMVAGRKAFEGKSYSSLVGAILSTEPQPLAPLWLERIVHRCLQKDPEERYQSIRDVLLDLRAGGSEPERKTAATRPWLAWSLAAAGIITAIVFGALSLRPVETQVYTASLLPPGKALFGELAVSPDGKMVAFTAMEDSRRQLYVRSLDSTKVQALAGTEAAEDPFWSRDGRSIAFFALGKLKRVDTGGGPVQTLCDAPAPRGGTWSEHGVILFSGTASTIMRVSDQGGTAVEVAMQGISRDSVSGRYPHFLPGGTTFLHTATNPGAGLSAGIYWTELETGKTKRLLPDRSNAAYARDRRGNGYLVFVREGALLAQPFDAAAAELKGAAFPLAERTSFSSLFGRGSFSVSRTGVLAYTSGNAGVRQLTWVARSGEHVAKVGAPDQIRRPMLSPDGKRVAYDVGIGNGSDLWVQDLERNISTRLTFDPLIEVYPVWSPDGTKIAYSEGQGNQATLRVRNANGSGASELLWQSPNGKFTLDWSDAAGALLYSEISTKTKLDIYALPMSGDRKPVAVLKNEFNEQSAVFSPDGKYIAYVSDESGRSEVYVQTYPLSGAKWQVSNGGGSSPRWRKDGREMFYLNEGSLMAVDVAPGAGFRLGAPVKLFSVAIRADAMETNERYAVSADGQRFLLALSPEGSPYEMLPTVVFHALDRPRR